MATPHFYVFTTQDPLLIAANQAGVQPVAVHRDGLEVAFEFDGASDDETLDRLAGAMESHELALDRAHKATLNGPPIDDAAQVGRIQARRADAATK